ncbi:MAG: hypothetical protein WCL61_00280 [bacterium]
MSAKKDPETWGEIPFLDLNKAMQHFLVALGDKAGAVIKRMKEDPDFAEKLAKTAKEML